MWKIKHLTGDDLRWPDRGNPYIYEGSGKYPRKTVVHPAPMYRHKESLVEDVLEICSRAFPIHSSVSKLLCTTDREFESGFNGYAFEDWDYSSSTFKYTTVDGRMVDRYPVSLGILISGKQVPQHPAWTRYLIAHEYGHCAWYASRYFRGYDNELNGEADYMRMRGEVDWKDGQRWHQRATEVIANDFRIIMGGQEAEHWPHDIAHPYNVPALVDWWHDSRDLCKAGELPGVVR